MHGGSLEIIRCPHNRVADAIALALSDLAPSQRREVASTLLDAEDRADLANEPLFVVTRGVNLCGAAWGQRQSGNIAIFWPPRFVGQASLETSIRLSEAVLHELDATAIEMTQVLVSASDEEIVPVLEHVGFRRLAELFYMTCEASRFPQERPKGAEFSFTTYEGAQRARLMRIIDRTYEGTLDCVGLNGVRDVDNVVTGYQATGTYRPENWLIVSARGADIGVVLLADHPKAGHFELMYMGLVPEARGRGWGRQITQHAQWLANRADAQRIVLAVDSVNEPALRMYRSTGFEMWDRRYVYVRFPATTSS
jgi:ribosomal protein S18 acetylase RimI-like enzyme